MSQLEHKFIQQAEIVSLEEETALLRFTDGQELRWPVKLLPEGIKKGAQVRVLLHDKATEEAERRSLAHSLLNELLDIGSR